MSVVIPGVFVAQIAGVVLLGLFLLLAGVWLSGPNGRTAQRPFLERSSLPMRWLDVMDRLSSILISPTAPRAPPTERPGVLQPVPVSTIAYRKRRSRPNDLS